MLGKVVLSLSAAAALTAGASLLPSQADASTNLVIKAKSGGHGGHGGHGGRHGRHRSWGGHGGHGGNWGGHGKHRRWRHHSYGPYYGYGWGGCRWKKRPRRVRVWDDYYGWRYRTVWRPVRICY